MPRVEPLAGRRRPRQQEGLEVLRRPPMQRAQVTPKTTAEQVAIPALASLAVRVVAALVVQMEPAEPVAQFQVQQPTSLVVVVVAMAAERLAQLSLAQQVALVAITLAGLAAGSLILLVLTAVAVAARQCRAPAIPRALVATASSGRLLVAAAAAVAVVERQRARLLVAPEEIMAAQAAAAVLTLRISVTAAMELAALS